MKNLFIRFGFCFALVAGLMFINPLDASSNTYAENPYDCNFNIHVGIGASVKFMGIELGATAEGYFVAEYANVAFACSINGVGCTTGLSCSDFWTQGFGGITFPDPY